VWLANDGPTGAPAVVFTVTADAGTSPAFDQTTPPLAGGEGMTVEVPFAEGETRTITVVARDASGDLTATGDKKPGHGHDEVWHFTLTRDCEQPDASVSAGCSPAGLAVTVTNTGGDTGSFAVDGTSADLAPGQQLVVDVPVAEGATVEVVVTVDGHPVDGSPFTFTRECEQPVVSAARDCEAGGAILNLGNDGPEETLLVVAKNGTPIDEVTVPGGDTITRLYPLSEDETAAFRVTGPGGFDSGDLVVVFDCIQIGPPAVVTAGGPPTVVAAGVTTRRLALTGSESTVLAIPGTLMVLLGGLALVASRRRTVR